LLPSVRARAKSEKRLVILDLEAVWRHWCHVMDQTTYGGGRTRQTSTPKGQQRPLPGVLLADLELGREPTRITIVGHKDDNEAATLFAAARAFPARCERLEWWDTSEGP